MKKVVTNVMIAHLWANQSQPEARNRHGSFFFEGDTAYSYRKSWPLARITGKTVEGHPTRLIVLFNSNRCSVTTGAHAGLAHRALYQHNILEISVPFISSYEFDAHPRNLKYLSNQVEFFIGKTRQARQHAESYLRATHGYAREFGIYKAAFLPEYPGTVSIPEDLAGIVAVKTEKNRIKQEQADERRRGREKAHIAAALTHLDAWRAGVIPLPHAYLLPVFLRKLDRGRGAPEGLRSDLVVQTSRGAEIPLDHARRVWNAVREVVSTGIEYQRNGHTLHAGAFTVDHIEADGTLHAGCHTIKLDEMQRFAEEEGWPV